MRRKPTTRIKRATSLEPLKAIIYTRLSKPKKGDAGEDAQRSTEISLDSQRDGCQLAITALGGEIVGIESDIISGDRLDRDGLWSAIQRIQAGEANALMVYKLDRLGRDHEQQGVVVGALRRAGARLLSATENLESGPLGEVLRALYTYGAAVELAAIRERTSRGFDSRFRQRQRYKPGQRSPYGYRKVGVGEATTYEIDPFESKIVIRAFTERAAGWSIRRILTGLNRDGIPSPTGRGLWGTSTLYEILGRDVYGTGQLECWRTRVVRDADGIPYVEERPADERYAVAFPAFLDPGLIERARVTGQRNQWARARSDRPAEVGMLRYGFAVCGTCGKRLTVSTRSEDRGGPHYTCSGSWADDPRKCPARPSIQTDRLDKPAWWFLQHLMEDPRRAAGYRVEQQPPELEAAMIEMLRLAETEIADFEAQAATLLENLSFLTGEAARAAGERVNALHNGIQQRRVVRDAAVNAAAAAAAAFPPVSTLQATDALGVLTLEAIAAMQAAEPSPEDTHGVMIWTQQGPVSMELPTSWKARRAAMAVFGMTVTVNQQRSDKPRWTAEVRLPGGKAMHGSWPECVPHRPFFGNMSSSSR